MKKLDELTFKEHVKLHFWFMWYVMLVIFLIGVSFQIIATFVMFLGFNVCDVPL